jgi:hypothetical protein
MLSACFLKHISGCSEFKKRHSDFWKKPNARGKPHRSAKHGGNLQAKLVGVGLTEKLGWGAKWKRT